MITSIDSQRENAGVRGILLHHDNASSHTALRTREFSQNSGLKTLPHPPYSPDLAPCDSYCSLQGKMSCVERDFRQMRSWQGHFSR